MSGVEYRLVPDYGGKYRVGDNGSMWSRRSNSKGLLPAEWKWLKGWPDKNGYPCVTLCKGKNRIKCGKIHRLVLESFVGPCPEGCECRHLNGIPSDNYLGNLRWGTPGENTQDAIRHGTFFTPWRGERNHRGKLTEIDVLNIREKLAEGKSQRAIAREFGVHGTTIWGIAHRVYWGWLK